MLFETLGQARIFLAMAGCGAAAAALYDAMTLARKAFEGRGAWVAEVLFAAAAGAMLFAAMVRTQQSGLRGYILLGAAVGWFLYACSVSAMLRWIRTKFCRFCRKNRDIGC